MDVLLDSLIWVGSYFTYFTDLCLVLFLFSDVSRYAGEYEHVYEATIAGVTVMVF